MATVNVVSSVTEESFVKSLKVFLETGFDSLDEPAMSPITAPMIPFIISYQLEVSLVYLMLIDFVTNCFL
jgi:hypothetical protein